MTTNIAIGGTCVKIKIRKLFLDMLKYGWNIDRHENTDG